MGAVRFSASLHGKGLFVDDIAHEIELASELTTVQDTVDYNHHREQFSLAKCTHMSQAQDRSERIRRFILQNVEKYPSSITQVACSQFDISRQTVNKHINRLVEENLLVVQGKARNRAYELRVLLDWVQQFDVTPTLTEDIVWENEIRPQLEKLSEAAMEIWEHGFTEMFNNAIDHSEGHTIDVHLSSTAVTTEITLSDDGVGIFRKIQRELGLSDERQAALELTKGKFTTAPDRHSGEGIFFTSRMFDSFEILSNGIYFTHNLEEAEQWTLDDDRVFSGTTVGMKLNNNTSRSIEEIFNAFSSGDDHAFNKTVVPVKLVQYGDSRLVSRSQAKRLLVRFDRFETIVLDFKGVDKVGQAFADEIFRVFQRRHPEIALEYINANAAVVRMISRALSHR